jgi:hypothetical protein
VCPVCHTFELDDYPTVLQLMQQTLVFPSAMLILKTPPRVIWRATPV